MPKAFDPEDFVSLALSLRQTVASHGVPPRLRASLIEDVVFQFATLVDEKTGSAIHESIFTVLGKHARQLGEEPAPADSLLAEVEIGFLKGRKAELNVLRSSLEKPGMLRLIVEIALGLRDTTEIKARLDTKRRFAELMKRSGGVTAVRFRMAGGGRRKWLKIGLNDSSYGSFDQSLDGLLACIRAVVARDSKHRDR
jgi:hypothetical protein